MFGIFKKKTKTERLQAKYESLMEEAYKLSKINRSRSDQKAFEANEILEQLEKLNQNN